MKRLSICCASRSRLNAALYGLLPNSHECFSLLFPTVFPISSFSCPLSFFTSPVLPFILVLNLVPIAFHQRTCSLTASPGRDLGSFLGNIIVPYFYPGLALLRVTMSPPHLTAASILLEPETHGGAPSPVVVGDIPHSGSLSFPQ
jgi:hypothetical protein